MPETLKSAAKQSASRVYGKRVLKSDEGYNILAAKEEKSCVKKKERNKREREEKRKQKEARKLCAAEAKSKKKTHKKKQNSTATDITQNTCCECLLTYEQDVEQGTGAEWVECVYGRWLHEECIDHAEHDENGQEKLCSSCCV